MIWKCVFTDSAFEVWQLGNWEFTRQTGEESFWKWNPMRQSPLKVCIRHPKHVEYDGAECHVCKAQREIDWRKRR